MKPIKSIVTEPDERMEMMKAFWQEIVKIVDSIPDKSKI